MSLNGKHFLCHVWVAVTKSPVSRQRPRSLSFVPVLPEAKGQFMVHENEVFRKTGTGKPEMSLGDEQAAEKTHGVGGGTRRRIAPVLPRRAGRGEALPKREQEGQQDLFRRTVTIAERRQENEGVLEKSHALRSTYVPLPRGVFLQGIRPHIPVWRLTAPVGWREEGEVAAAVLSLVQMIRPARNFRQAAFHPV